MSAVDWKVHCLLRHYCCAEASFRQLIPALPRPCVLLLVLRSARIVAETQTLGRAPGPRRPLDTILVPAGTHTRHTKFQKEGKCTYPGYVSRTEDEEARTVSLFENIYIQGII